MMGKREPLMDAAYFEYLIKLRKNNTAKFESVIQNKETTEQHRSSALHRLFTQSYQVLIAQYSQGESIGKLADSFPEVVSRYERYVAAPMGGKTDFNTLDDYVESLWLVSLAILLDIDNGLFKRLLNCIGNAGKDQLFERLIRTRLTGERPAAQKLVWPSPYQALYDAIDPGLNAGMSIKKFLQRWYPLLRECYWHDNHKGPQGGGFFGYWCLEAAAVVKAFGIDDSSFRDMPYYPKDLVHGVVSNKM